MTWAAPISHAVGDILTASDWNTNTVNNPLALYGSVSQLGGAGTSAYGTPPAIGTGPYYHVAGIQYVNFTAGVGTLTFPNGQFPNGWIGGNFTVIDTTVSHVNSLSVGNVWTATSTTLTLNINGSGWGSSASIMFDVEGF